MTPKQLGRIASLRRRLLLSRQESMRAEEHALALRAISVKEQCFKPYFTTSRLGTGLRLFTARRVIEAHGSSISVESGEGADACFTIALPRPTSSELE